MKYYQKRVGLVLLVLAVVFTLACTKHLPEKKFVTKDAGFNLLIAGQASEFKDDIVTTLLDRYKDRGNIDLLPLGGLKHIQCEDYDAILVMDACKAWTWFNFSTKSFLKKSVHCNNVVLFMTAGDPDWEYRYGDLDAITSASIMDHEGQTIDEITAEIDRMIPAGK